MKLNRKISLVQPNNFDQLNFGTWIWYSLENRILVSEEFCNMVGISKNGYNNFNLFFDIIHGSDLLKFMKVIDEMLKGASPRWFKFKIVRPDNSIINICCFFESMSDEFANIFDITGTCFETKNKKSKTNLTGYKYELVQMQ
jgi:PAS fold